MTPALREQLERKGTAPFGGLDGGVVCGPRLIESAEFAAAGAASYAAVGAKVENGLMFNLSYAAGRLSVDVVKNGRIYGADVTTADILEGRVPEPPELQPLYGDLAGIVHTVERVSAPSLTRSSLDRATLGEWVCVGGGSGALRKSALDGPEVCGIRAMWSMHPCQTILCHHNRGGSGSSWRGAG